ncbi:hypothetical protein GGX14DRAFT_485479 [Mycena pura]|uniref:GATA-type domain-containing protein n=1 Tax=Mycena pura TaxID=153505 RepID=A0AAD6URN3_9AGAR|nr:hypothetical protein GGX14DRAFT_485479 [Mycena pura]
MPNCPQPSAPRMKDDGRFIYTNPGESIRRGSRARSCAKCGSPKSPTWRLGADGQTLCNKCGLQYRRGLKKPREGSIGAFAHRSPSRPVSSTAIELSAIPPSITEVTDNGSEPNTGFFADSAEAPYTSWDLVENIPSLPPEPFNAFDQDATAQTHADAAGFYTAQDTNGSIRSFGDLRPGHEIVDLMALSAKHAPEPTPVAPQPSQTLARYSPNTFLPYTSSNNELNVFDFPVNLSPPNSAQLDYAPRASTRSSAAFASSLASFLEYCSAAGTSHRPDACIQEVDDPQEASEVGVGSTGAVSSTQDTDHGTQCPCTPCLRRLFLGTSQTISGDNPMHYLEQPLTAFYARAAAVHHAALQRQSSVYVATETFIREVGEDHRLVTTFATLRPDLGLAPSQSSRYPALMAAGWDLVFDHVITAATYPTPLNDWLHGQTMMKHLTAERAKSSLWDMTRLPPGQHVPDSQTFRWLQRTLLNVETSAGPLVTLNIQSGNDKYPFRKLHGALSLMKHANTFNRLALYRSLEPRLQDACTESCQEWYIAVLDEAAKLSGRESQLSLLEANKKYMLDSMDIYMGAFLNMGVERSLHVCSDNCTSHVQPSFRSLVSAARDALHDLFAPPEKLLGSIQGISAAYPTQRQLFLTRLVGLTQFKLYYSYSLMPKDKKATHSTGCRSRLTDARLELAKTTPTGLIWNYLPVEIGRRATAKLAQATEALGAGNMYIV